MFGPLAPKLRDNGWAALIPLWQGEKRPAISGWEAFNIHAPSDRQIEHWCSRHPHAGIGLCYGPDGVLGSDLDFLDPDKAAAARRINDESLGDTPMIRIGRRPKVLAFYRSAPGLQVPGKDFGGFELFRSSGQTVLYGVHPDTRQPYHWPDESPESISPDDLPVVNQVMLDRFIARMEPLREDRVTHNGVTVKNTGATASWLRHFSELTTIAEMVEAACAGIRGVGVGARHHTMQATTMALVTRGIAPDEFMEDVERAYFDTLNADEVRARRNAVREAAKWANAKAWGGAVDIRAVKLKINW